MSKLLRKKKEMLPEENSFHISQIATSSVSTTAFNAALMIGEANAALIPCAFQMENPAGCVINSGKNIANTGSTNGTLLYVCPKPTNRGGKKLYVGDLVIDADDLDPTDDFIDAVYVDAVDWDTTTNLITDLTNKIAAAEITYSSVGVDCSALAQVVVRVVFGGGTAGEMLITAVRLECWYDD